MISYLNLLKICIKSPVEVIIQIADPESELCPVKNSISIEKNNWEIYRNNDIFHTFKPLITQMDEISENLQVLLMTEELISNRVITESVSRFMFLVCISIVNQF